MRQHLRAPATAPIDFTWPRFKSSSSSRRTLRGQTAIIGAGLSAVGRVPGKGTLSAPAADAAEERAGRAGIDKREVDGVLYSSAAFASPFVHRFSVAFSEYLGIQPILQHAAGLRRHSDDVQCAAAAIASGLAKTVLVVGGTQPADRPVSPDLAFAFDDRSRDQQYYRIPFGIPVAPSP